MICRNCKKTFDDKFSFCPWCGEGAEQYSYDLTLGEVHELWSDEHFPQISKKGIESYHSAWNRLRVYENFRMTSIKTMHFQKIISQMIQEKKSRSSMEKVKQLASQLCKYAMKNDIISKNYGALITLPKARKSTRDRFSDEELDILWSHSSDETVRIILILAYTGFRINELFSLTKENVHLDEPIPYIVGGSKTDAGRDRSVVVCEKIIGFVNAAYHTEGNYLFTNQAGKAIDVCNWRKRHYYPTLEHLGLPRREIHCLRHTFASMMVKAGADPKSIAQMMGHSRFSTTIDIYAHADLKQLSNAVKLI